jgi:hypothetical protein
MVHEHGVKNELSIDKPMCWVSMSEENQSPHITQSISYIFVSHKNPQIKGEIVAFPISTSIISMVNARR